MDTKLLERARKFLIPVIVLLAAVLAAPDRAAAQNGACPPNSYLTITPQGTWPSDVSVCSYSPGLVVAWNDILDWFPCDQQIRAFHGNLFAPDTLYVVYVPDENQYYGSQVRFKALLFGAVQFAFPPVPPPGWTLDNAYVRVQYFNNNGILSWGSYQKASTYAYIDTQVEGGYYRVYLIDETMGTYSGQGGYIRFGLTYEPDEDQVKRNWGISSVRIGNYYDTMPEHCPVPNANLPNPPTPPYPTSTLPPTWTPNPTAGTPTPTPITTPQATAVGGTPPPAWTPTPFSFPTVPAENTPTPWAPVSIPTIAWPTLPPTVVVGVIPTIDTTLGGIDALVETLNDDWQPSVDFGASAIDLDNADTTGTGSPNAIISEITALVSVPVSYVKAIGTYLPNTAPYVAFLVLMASWVPFNMMAKFGLTILSRLFELIRRIIELIPGF